MQSRKLFSSAAAIVAIATAAPAAAQSEGAVSSESDSGIADIVVTAQRYEQTAQRTSLVVTAFDEEGLVGVTDVRQLQTLSPGIQLGNAGNIVQTYIRGVGSLNAQSSQEAAVAFNADGIFLFTSSMISPMMYDLERVEILKGPQGTLYGRNASGGAVNLLTRGASTSGIEGYVEAEYGNYDQFRMTGAVNLPFSDTLALRVAAQHVEHDGYLSDGLDDQNMTAGRVRLLWEPSASITVRAGVDIAFIDTLGAGSSIEPNPTDDKFVGGLDPRVNTGPTRLGVAPPYTDPFYQNDQWSAIVQLDADLGFADLTLLPAYRSEHIDTASFVPGYLVSENTRLKQKSVEARLANQGDRLKWVLGAYYFQADLPSTTVVRNESNFQNGIVSSPFEVESYAFFGEATFGVVDGFRLIGGLRYTHEQSERSGTSNSLIGRPGLFLPPPAPPGTPNVQTPAFNPWSPLNPRGELLDYLIASKARKNAVTWKGGFEFDVGPDSLLFATASEGFKGGGSYVDIPTADATFQPEYLTAFELGSKNRFFGNSLQLNGEIFYWKLKDQQVPYVGFNSTGNVAFVTANAGKAHMYGANVDLLWKPSPADTIHLGLEYLESEYDSFVRVVPTLVVAGVSNSICDITVNGAVSTFDCTGLRLLKAPKWAGSASYDRRFDLANGGNITFDASMTFTSARYMQPDFIDTARQDASALFNASLTYNAPGAAVSVTAWINNITNERIISNGGQANNSFSRPTLMPPRTFGLRARYSF